MKRKRLLLAIAVLILMIPLSILINDNIINANTTSISNVYSNSNTISYGSSVSITTSYSLSGGADYTIATYVSGESTQTASISGSSKSFTFSTLSVGTHTYYSVIKTYSATTFDPFTGVITPSRLIETDTSVTKSFTVLPPPNSAPNIGAITPTATSIGYAGTTITATITDVDGNMNYARLYYSEVADGATLPSTTNSYYTMSRSGDQYSVTVSSFYNADYYYYIRAWDTNGAYDTSPVNGFDKYDMNIDNKNPTSGPLSAPLDLYTSPVSGENEYSITISDEVGLPSSTSSYWYAYEYYSGGTWSSSNWINVNTVSGTPTSRTLTAVLSNPTYNMQYRLKWRFQDNAGNVVNTGTTVAKTVLDGTNPTSSNVNVVTGSEPANNRISTWQVNLYDTGGIGIDTSSIDLLYRVDGVEYTSASSAVYLGNNQYQADLLEFADHPYGSDVEVRFYYKDMAGNAAYTPYSGLYTVLDRIIPTYTSPVVGTLNSIGPNNITIDVEDADSGIASNPNIYLYYQYSTDDGTSWSATTTVQMMPYDDYFNGIIWVHDNGFVATLGALPANAQIKFNIEMRDRTNINVATYSSITYTVVDDDNPVFSGENVSPSTTPAQGEAVTVSVNVDDPSSDLQSVTLYTCLDISCTSTTSYPMIRTSGTLQNGVWSYTLPGLPNYNDKYIYYFRAVDIHGNIITYSAGGHTISPYDITNYFQIVYQDTTAPVGSIDPYHMENSVRISGLKSGYKASFTINYQDMGTGVDTTDIRFNYRYIMGLWTEVILNGGANSVDYTVDILMGAGQTIEYYTIVKDLSGNSIQTVTETVTIADDTAPVISGGTSGDRTVKDVITVSVTANDELSLNDAAYIRWGIDISSSNINYNLGNGPVIGSVTGSTGTFTYNIPAFTHDYIGYFVFIEVTIYDMAGNAAVDYYTVQLTDGEDPVITVTGLDNPYLTGIVGGPFIESDGTTGSPLVVGDTWIFAWISEVYSADITAYRDTSNWLLEFALRAPSQGTPLSSDYITLDIGSYMIAYNSINSVTDDIFLSSSMINTMAFDIGSLLNDYLFDAAVGDILYYKISFTDTNGNTDLLSGNRALRDDVAPSLVHSASNPNNVEVTVGVQLTVSVEVRDPIPSDVVSGFLHYEIRSNGNDNPQYYPRTDITAIPNADKNIWNATIPALDSYQSVRYWWVLTDNSGNTGYSDTNYYDTPYQADITVSDLEYQAYDPLGNIGAWGQSSFSINIYTDTVFRYLNFNSLNVYPTNPDGTSKTLGERIDSQKDLRAEFSYSINGQPWVSLNSYTVPNNYYSFWKLPAQDADMDGSIFTAKVDLYDDADTTSSDPQITDTFNTIISDTRAPSITVLDSPAEVKTGDIFSLDVSITDVYSNTGSGLSDVYMLYTVIDGAQLVTSGRINTTFTEGTNTFNFQDTSASLLLREYYNMQLELEIVAYDNSFEFPEYSKFKNRGSYTINYIIGDGMPAVHTFNTVFNNTMNGFNISGTIIDSETVANPNATLKYRILNPNGSANTTWSEFISAEISDGLYRFNIIHNLTLLYGYYLQYSINSTDINNNSITTQYTTIIKDGVSPYIGSVVTNNPAMGEALLVEFLPIDDHSGINWGNIIIRATLWAYVTKIRDTTKLEMYPPPQLGDTGVEACSIDTLGQPAWPCYPGKEGYNNGLGTIGTRTAGIYYNSSTGKIELSWNGAAMGYNPNDALDWGEGTTLYMNITFQDAEGNIYSQDNVPLGELTDNIPPEMSYNVDSASTAIYGAGQYSNGHSIDFSVIAQDPISTDITIEFAYRLRSWRYSEDGYGNWSIIEEFTSLEGNGLPGAEFYFNIHLKYGTEMQYYILARDSSGNEVYIGSELTPEYLSVQNDINPPTVSSVSNTAPGNDIGTTITATVEDIGLGYSEGKVVYETYSDNAWYPQRQLADGTIVPGYYAPGWTEVGSVNFQIIENITSVSYANFIQWRVENAIPRWRYNHIGGLYNTLRYSLTLTDKNGNTGYNISSKIISIEDRLEPTVVMDYFLKMGDNIDETIIRFGVTGFDEKWGGMPMSTLTMQYNTGSGWIDAPLEYLAGDAGDWEIYRQYTFPQFAASTNVSYSWRAQDMAGNVMYHNGSFVIQDRIAPLISLDSENIVGSSGIDTSFLVTAIEIDSVIENVTLYYEVDYSGNWISSGLISLGGDQYLGSVPSLESGRYVNWKLVAYDSRGNMGTLSGNYRVIDNNAPSINIWTKQFEAGEMIYRYVRDGYTLSFSRYYDNPVVIVSENTDIIRSGNLTQQAIVSDITHTSAYIRHVEDVYSGVDYALLSIIVMEAGSYRIGNNSYIEVGTVNSSTHTDFYYAMDPVIITTVQNANYTQIRSRVVSYNSTGFDISLENGNGSIVASDSIVGYMAFDRNSSSYDARIISANSTYSMINHTTSNAIVFAQVVSNNEANGYAVISNTTDSSVYIGIEEGGTMDGIHTSEEIAMLILPVGIFSVDIIANAANMTIEADITDFGSDIISVVIEYRIGAGMWINTTMRLVGDYYYIDIASPLQDEYIMVKITVIESAGNSNISYYSIRGL